MKRAVLLILVALFTITILLFIYNPGVLDKVWLWIVGLIGPIIAVIRNGANAVVNAFSSKGQDRSKDHQPGESAIAMPVSQAALPEKVSQHEILAYEERIDKLKVRVKDLEQQVKQSASEDDFEGTTLSVLRYFDDKQTTLGLLFIEEEFFCYTLEDTHRDVKVKGATRIPAGTYRLGYMRALTPLTKKYRQTRPWFEYHLHVKDVPNYTGVYIHSGSTHKHTEGCLLVADSIYSSSEKRSIFNSRATFEKLYKKLQPILNNEKKVRIKYFDENWYNNSNISNLKTSTT